MSKVLDISEKQIKPIIEGMGYEVVDIEYAKKHNAPNLTFYIYSSNGITLDDCEKVHNAINPIIDELDPTNNEPYVLNVSSPGLDRPFKKQRDYERNYQKEVEVKLYAPLKGKKLYEGTLIEHTENVTVISANGKEIKFENNSVAFVRPLVKFE